MSDAYETLRALENKLDQDAKERQEQLPKLRLRLKTLLQRIQEKHKLMAEQVAPGSQPHIDFNNIEITLANVNRFIGNNASANLSELLYLKQLLEDYLKAAQEAELAQAEEMRMLQNQIKLENARRAHREALKRLEEATQKNPLETLLRGGTLNHSAMSKLKADVPKMSSRDKERLERALRNRPELRLSLGLEPGLRNRPRLVMY